MSWGCGANCSGERRKDASTGDKEAKPRSLAGFGPKSEIAVSVLRSLEMALRELPPASESSGLSKEFDVGLLFAADETCGSAL